MRLEHDVRIATDAADLAEGAAVLVLATLAEALAGGRRARIVLAGGTTPGALFRRLARQPAALDWSKVDFYWGDERCVPPTAPESNYRAAREALLDPLGVEAARCFRIRGEAEPGIAVHAYDEVVAAALRAGVWDLVLLGLGTDGHTASLFPGGREEGGEWVVATRAPVEPRSRISLGYKALARAHRTIFLVSGASKEAALSDVLSPSSTLPAARVAGAAANVSWCVDRAAAGKLPPTV